VSSEGRLNTDFQIQESTPVQYDGEDFCWFHARVCAVPGSAGQGRPAAVMTLQKHLNIDDFYSGMHTMRTEDGGASWVGPDAIPELDWVREADGSTVSVCDATPGWHAPTGRLLVIGVRVRYDPKGRQGKAYETAYAFHDPATGQWSRWKILSQAPDCGCCCSQWTVEPDGSLLLPLSSKSVPAEGEKPRRQNRVARCHFDGEELTVSRWGAAVAVEGDAELLEPSLAAFQGRYYLTLRSDGNGYVAVSDDGLHFGQARPWRFDDGSELGSDHTQQHWLAHSDGLFLVYTRRTPDNGHVARNRAPLFVAQVDPQGLFVRRETERVLLSERGVPMGNFGAATMDEKEAWVTVGEFMWPDYVRQNCARERGSCGAVRLARVLWSDLGTGA
jgi:hypothetical protein